MTDALFADAPAAPPFDPELAGTLAALSAVTPHATEETLLGFRRAIDEAPRPDLTVSGTVTVSEWVVAGPDSSAAIPVTVLSPAVRTVDLPVILYIHGGALVLGNRYMNLDRLLPYVAESAAVVVSVGYRFAPEHPAPTQLEDCYAALLWTVENAAELSIDPERITVMGISAGGGLALGVSLLARDRQGPTIGRQVLVAPMLDDRFREPSSTTMEAFPSDRKDIAFGWRAALGDAYGGQDVSAYVAPARMDDLCGLPRTFLDCGTSDGFRDEVVVMATRLCRAGVLVDLHLWGSGFHGFDLTAPQPALSRAAHAARDEFIRRALSA